VRKVTMFEMVIRKLIKKRKPAEKKF
jgi:hypothetical protein